MSEEYFKLLEKYCTTLKCIKCENLSYHFGFCYEHFDKEYILIFLKKMQCEIYHGIAHKKISITPKNIKKLHEELTCYIAPYKKLRETLIEIKFDFSHKLKKLQNIKSIPQPTNLNFFISTFNNINHKTINYQQIINDLTTEKLYFLNKHINYKSILSEEMYINLLTLTCNINLIKSNIHQLNQIINYQTPTYTKTTNALFIQQFINAIQNVTHSKNFSHHIQFLKEEHTEKINNKKLRFDIFMIVRSNDGTKQKIFIEIDENYQFSTSHDKTNDILKDLFCLQNGYSLCRYYCKTRCISNDDIMFIQEYIKTIIILELKRKHQLL
jgi:hypothetical protein